MRPEGPLLGLVPAARLERADTAPASAPPRPAWSSRSSANSRVRRGGTGAHPERGTSGVSGNGSSGRPRRPGRPPPARASRGKRASRAAPEDSRAAGPGGRPPASSRQAAISARSPGGRSRATNSRPDPGQVTELFARSGAGGAWPRWSSGRGCRRGRREARPGASARASRPSLMLQHTVPTGFSSLPPPGPAMPVIDTAVSAPKRSSAPAAIASATSLGHGPVGADQRPGHPEQRDLGLVRVGDDPARHVVGRPGRSVSRAAISPAVHDSASAIGVPASRAATWSSSRAVLREERARRGVAGGPRAARRRRRRRRLVAGDHLDLAAPQAGGDLEPSEALDPAGGHPERLGELRLGHAEHAQHACS